MALPEGTWQAALGGLVLGTAATAMLATTGKNNDQIMIEYRENLEVFVLYGDV